jgi:hypothetical protein
MGLDDVFRRNGDLKGVVPESWLCIDCGTNTAPGWPNRVETEEIVMEARRSRKNVDDIMARKVRATTGRHREIYTVLKEVWKAAGVEEMGGCLCVGCLEKRLGRTLKPRDFTDHSFNERPCSARLRRRRRSDKWTTRA